MYTAKNSLNEKFSSLDYFRGFAGYGVAICHYYYYIYNLKHFEYLSFFFVEFFFILSGYVLTPQIIKVYNQNKNLKIFFLRRWMRTIPLFILAVILYSILFKRFDLDTLKYFFLIQNFFPNFLEKEYISILWSLSIEEYFYLTTTSDFNGQPDSEGRIRMTITGQVTGFGAGPGSGPLTSTKPAYPSGFRGITQYGENGKPETVLRWYHPTTGYYFSRYKLEYAGNIDTVAGSSSPTGLWAGLATFDVNYNLLFLT